MMNLFSGKIKSAFVFVKNQFWQIDWKLLLFLLFFLNVKLYLKIFAVIFIYLFRPNFRFGFRPQSSRLPLFYVAIIIISLLNLLIFRLYTNIHYDAAFVTGVFFWLLSILAIHQIKLSVENTNHDILNNTLVAFFIINAIVSFINILDIIIETGALNPYQYQGLFQKYFIGTGDYIKGIFFDTSTTNAIINAFGVVYFLSKKNVLMTLTCMVVLLSTASNTTNLLLIVALIFIFIFQSNRDQKSVITICLFLLILFMIKVSPQNNEYAGTTFKRIYNKEDIIQRPIIAKRDEIYLPAKKSQTITSFTDSAKKILPKQKLQIAALINSRSTFKKPSKPKPEINPVDTITKKSAEQKQPIAVSVNIPNPWLRPSLPKPDINSFEYQSSTDTTLKQKELIEFAKLQNMDSSIAAINNSPQNMPGKLIALQQTFHFFKQHPSKVITGNGIGNFSSKLAFRATALKIAGGYPDKFEYISNNFKINHLALYLFYFIKRAGLHSVINTPDSVYDQLFSEYGLAGLIFFLFLYPGFFLKHIKKQSYSIPLLIILAGVFFLGYWFEQLSVVIIFELLMLMDMKKNHEEVISKPITG
jgi:hypothetical protein